MAEIEFIYNENSITFQCNLNEKLKDILVEKLTSKIEINLESVSYLYSKKSIDNLELTLDELTKDKEKEEKNDITIEIFDPINMDSSEYKIVEELGEGENRYIYKVFNREKNKYFVIKGISIKKENKISVNNILKEAKLLSIFNNKNIVKYYNSKKENKNFYILMEYCDGKNLEEFIKNHKKNNENDINKFINEVTLFNIIKQLCSGLKEIHDKNIIHRDIKPSNIFINNENEIKIGDFGISKQLNSLKDTTITKKGAGTPNYIAPEIVKDGKYNKKADIYSLGCIFYELFTLNNYFTDKIYGDIKTIDKNKYDPNWQKLIDSMLIIDLNERLDINQINEFINQNIKINLDNKNEIEVVDNSNESKQVKIYVKTASGQIIKGNLHLDQRIKEIRYFDYILEVYFLYHKLILSYNGKHLNHKNTFRDYCFKDGDTIGCLPLPRGCNSPKPNISIFINYKDKTFEIKGICENCSKVRDLKLSIFGILNLSKYGKYKGICELRYNGVLLQEENEKIKSFGITKNSFINVTIFEELFEYIKKYSFQLYNLYQMGFDEEEIDIGLFKQCMGDIPYYFENIFEF